jgi:hypothetical protein
MLLDGHRIVGPALHRGIVGDDHHLAALDTAHARNDSGTRRGVVIKAMRGSRAHLKKRRTGVKQPRHPFARQDLATRYMPFPCRFAAAIEGCLHGFIDHRQRVEHRLAVGVELFTARRCGWFEDGHQAVSWNISRPISIRRISLVPAPIS